MKKKRKSIRERLAPIMAEIKKENGLDDSFKGILCLQCRKPVNVSKEGLLYCKCLDERKGWHQAKQKYWRKVIELLVSKHHLSVTRATKAVRNYKKEIVKRKIGDIMYHTPVDETADGIITGEYHLRK